MNINNFLYNIFDENKNYTKKAEIGFKSISFEIFEIIKFLDIKYFIDEERNKSLPNNISDLVIHPLWVDIGNLLFFMVRPWYNRLNEKLESYFYEYVDYKIVSYIFIFISIIIIISIYYWIVWKKYENDFINSIKKSFELINLIPEEIKNI